MSGERVTRAEFARRRGVSRAYISRLVQEGMLPLRGDLLDVEECNLILNEKTDLDRSNDGNGGGRPSRGSRSHPPSRSSSKSTFEDARALNETYKAKLSRLRYEEASGKLVSREEALAEAFREGRSFRHAFESLGARVRDQIADEGDPIEVQKIIDKAVFNILMELSSTSDNDGLSSALPGHE